MNVRNHLWSAILLFSALGPLSPPEASAQPKPPPASSGRAPAPPAPSVNPAPPPPAPARPTEGAPPDPAIFGGGQRGVMVDKPARTGITGKVSVRWRNVGALVKQACSGKDEAFKSVLPCGDPDWQSRNADRIAARMGPRAFSAGAGPATPSANLCTALLSVTPPPTAPVGMPVQELLTACRPEAPAGVLVERACSALAAKRTEPEFAAAAGKYEKALGCAKAWWKDADQGSRPAGETRIAGTPLCDAVTRTPDVESLRTVPAIADLHAACGRTEKAFAMAGLTSFLMPMVQGTGDFLQERAREELVGFAVERFGHDFCEPGSGPINGAALFPASCAELFPDGLSRDADLEAIHSGRFQRVIAGELLGVPLRLLAPDGLPISGEDEKRLRIMVYQLASAIREAVRERQSGVEFLAGIEPAVFKALGGDAPRECTWKKGAPPGVPCTLLLALTLSSRAGEVLSLDDGGNIENGMPDGVAWIDGAAAHFCRRYGGKPDAADATCLFDAPGPTDAARWAKMRRMVEAAVTLHNALGDVRTAYDNAVRNGRPPYEAGLEAATGVTRALDDFTGSAIELAQGLAEGSGGDGAAASLGKLKRALDLTQALLAASTAATKHDFRAVSAGLRVVLTSPLVAAKVDPGFKRGLGFVLDLAEARTRDDVKKALADNAAPLGSYKAKYQARKTLVGLNGFVGFFAGATRPAWQSGDTGKYRAPDRFTAQALSAPLGIDVSFPAILHDPAGKQANHLGLSFLLVDPLAIRVAEVPKGTAGDTSTQVDFSGVLAPGVFLRWGIFKSPLVLLVGGRVQPLQGSVEQTCGAKGSDACWRVPISVLGGLAVDVPVLPFN